MPAPELLIVGYGGRQHIRKNALQHLQPEITFTRKPGSFTLSLSRDIDNVPICLAKASF